MTATGCAIESTDRTLGAAALREAVEETGLAETDSICHGLFDVDVHDIPAKPGVRCLFTSVTKDVHISAKSKGFQWGDLASIHGADYSDSVIRMAKKSLTKLRGSQ